MSTPTEVRYLKFITGGEKYPGPSCLKGDNAIHQIKLYPLDCTLVSPTTYPLESDLSSRQHYHVFEQLGPGLFPEHMFVHVSLVRSNKAKEFTHRQVHDYNRGLYLPNFSKLIETGWIWCLFSTVIRK